MSFKPFFIHRQNREPKELRSKRALNGFTVFVQPSDVERTVSVQVSMCHASDAFCRKTGRESAKQKPIIAINPRDLPKLVAKLEDRIHDHKDSQTAAFSFEYLYKYML